MKTVVIGIDCFDPYLVFDRYAKDLPNLAFLCNNGRWGELESCTPPITVPAWSVMMSGKSPGGLGIYGFKNRADYEYDSDVITPNVSVDRVWDYFNRAGKPSIVLSVPGTYPPSSIKGTMVSCFMTPREAKQYVQPIIQQGRIELLLGDRYSPDVYDFRDMEPITLFREVQRVTRERFLVFNDLITSQEWDFAMMVEMGADRLHHAFWHTIDKWHKLHGTDDYGFDLIGSYYEMLDAYIGSVLSNIDLHFTTVLIVSDHGAKRMDGGFALNDWFRQEGYLTMKPEWEKRSQTSNIPRKFSPDDVDWGKTFAWTWGGYYGRIFFNIEGREPEGIVKPGEIENLKKQIKEELPQAVADKIPGETLVVEPRDIYETCEGVPPDLMVFFGDLHWRVVGSVGNEKGSPGSLYTYKNDTGFDAANHSMYGMFILYNGTLRRKNVHVTDATIYDVAPTLLRSLGVMPPNWMEADGQGLVESLGDFAVKGSRLR